MMRKCNDVIIMFEIDLCYVINILIHNLKYILEHF